jgi:hypothetical protein
MNLYSQDDDWYTNWYNAYYAQYMSQYSYGGGTDDWAASLDPSQISSSSDASFTASCVDTPTTASTVYNYSYVTPAMVKEFLTIDMSSVPPQYFSKFIKKQEEETSNFFGDDDTAAAGPTGTSITVDMRAFTLAAAINMKVISLDDVTMIKPVVRGSPLSYYFLDSPAYGASNLSLLTAPAMAWLTPDPSAPPSAGHSRHGLDRESHCTALCHKQWSLLTDALSQVCNKTSELCNVVVGSGSMYPMFMHELETQWYNDSSPNNCACGRRPDTKCNDFSFQLLFMYVPKRMSRRH